MLPPPPTPPPQATSSLPTAAAAAAAAPEAGRPIRARSHPGRRRGSPSLPPKGETANSLGIHPARVAQALGPCL